MTIREWDEVEPAMPARPLETEDRVALTPQRLVELYADDVWRYASSKLRRREDAEDAAMEVFASAMREFPRLSKAQSPRLWLLGIARNKVNDCLRRRYRRSESSLSEAIATPAPSIPLRESLLDTLDELPDLHREVLVLKYVSGLSTDEVARVIRKSSAATNSLLQRARKFLRDRARPLLEAPGGNP